MTPRAAMRRLPTVVVYEEVLPFVSWGNDREPSRWCAADSPTESDDLRLKPLYRTGKLTGKCATCGLELKELAR